ncbi:458_t:CDS:10 [Acaulospora morrowiae]|uniref:458_t:CDS:1 n=1 Tax=Acaulospora morrowiae TaxID=94023 RepID=A0A9N9AFY4_9GLOM|nr:458_t:CDS:10 [Acaulospora morrowiae]
MSKIHEYFKKKYTKWGIIDFLNECDIESFDSMIDDYVKSLDAIANSGQGENQERAKQLLNRYRKASSLLSHKTSVGAQDPRPDYQSARKWKSDRNSTSAHDGSSVNFHNSTFTGNLVRTGSISGNLNLSNKAPKRDIEYEKNHVIKEERAFKKSRPQSPENEDELNSGISSVCEDEDEYCSDVNSDKEDTAELADISFNSFVNSKTDNKNYNWKLKNNESVRGRLINMTKEAIEEARKTKKVDSKLMNIIRLGLSSIVDLSSEFKGSMHSWFGDNWMPLKREVLSKIDLKVEKFTGEVSELITKVENLCGSYDYLGARKILLEKVIERPVDSQIRQVAKIYFNIIDLFLENPYIFIKKDGRLQNHTEIQYVMILAGPILDIIFSDQRDFVRLIWGETVSKVTNDSRRKIDLCIRTEDGTKELSHSECAREATFVKILKDRCKSLRTNKCILDKYLENNIPDEALEDTAIFGLQLAALEGQLIGIDLLDEGLYFGFDGPAFNFPAQICNIEVLRQALEVLYYFKIQWIIGESYQKSKIFASEFMQ